jgi:hypothetical protein
MNFFEPIDIYCERLDASFWAEPLNAISNAAFLLAAMWVWYHHRYRRPSIEIKALILILTVIGIGSFLFHSFATGWAMLADVIPITIFILLYLWTYLKYIARVGWIGMIFYFGLFFLASTTIGQLIPGEVVNGSQAYLAPWLALAAMGAYVFWSNNPQLRISAKYYLMAFLLFGFSLTMRTIDAWVCDQVTIGTHFVWHICNAAVLWILIHCLAITKPNYNRAGSAS